MSRRREGEGGQRGREIGEEGGNGGKSRGREAGEAVVGEEAATEEGVASRDVGRREKKKEMAGPTFGGGNGGPPRLENGRGNLEGYAKYGLV
jgi:hypothetical protein